MKLEPIDLPPLHELTYAQLDEIYDLTGIDVLSPTARISERFCATEFWARRKSGQDVTYEQIRNEGNLAGINTDPGPAESPKGTGSGSGSRSRTRST